ncbi:hypothetical protein MAA_02756 [Metarhizium robertsii ARSEF 23]|uniref:Uncharacterized protein n=1 Tax=Metarhizium robertsii (strain ARSEF 23 / ATCC MYA-3075) TaxID=655844 RepID=E9ES10_METRA|nr:uncharacterized protein MAA_02756 [Metarhizium robertsii ARSEF 23]EFZ01527.1 hypothetical protein MAA_02756 [Metarhizium robertsii ARSEF 23]
MERPSLFSGFSQKYFETCVLGQQCPTTLQMAEVVGLVASVVTLGERTTKVVKLKSLWDKVRNVPEDIQSQLDELEALNILITEVEAEAAAEQDALRDTPAGALSLRYCKKAAKELEDVI